MYLKEYSIKKKHTRTSKLGTLHAYFRSVTIIVLRCDSCNNTFERARGSMDPKRISNNYFHVCENCDAKAFAQRKGVDRRKIWDMPAGSDMPIGRY